MKPSAASEHALDAWCRRRLGSGVDEVLFTAGYLSFVAGVRLADGRTVVVKVRPASARLFGCVEVHQALWRAGFPCPQPLVGPVRLDGYAVTAESLVPGGDVLPLDPEPYARLLADLVRLAPPSSSVRSLAPNPPWIDWDHDRDGVWPRPDDRDVDLQSHVDQLASSLNARGEPAWLDEVGRRVRRRLERTRGEPTVVGHGDWEAQNLRWRDGRPLAVHDWDSVVSAPESVIVGAAAAVWTCGAEPEAEPRAASVDESEAFGEAYQRASGRRWSTEEVQASWAAGLWVYAFNAKKLSLDGVAWLTEDEATQRLHRAGA